MFFFEKKNQKTFTIGVLCLVAAAPAPDIRHLAQAFLTAPSATALAPDFRNHDVTQPSGAAAYADYLRTHPPAPPGPLLFAIAQDNLALLTTTTAAHLFEVRNGHITQIWTSGPTPPNTATTLIPTGHATATTTAANTALVRRYIQQALIGGDAQANTALSPTIISHVPGIASAQGFDPTARKHPSRLVGPHPATQLFALAEGTLVAIGFPVPYAGDPGARFTVAIARVQNGHITDWWFSGTPTGHPGPHLARAQNLRVRSKTRSGESYGAVFRAPKRSGRLGREHRRAEMLCQTTARTRFRTDSDAIPALHGPESACTPPHPTPIIRRSASSHRGRVPFAPIGARGAAEGATGPRKRSGSRTAVGCGPLESRQPARARRTDGVRVHAKAHAPRGPNLSGSATEGGRSCSASGRVGDLRAEHQAMADLLVTPLDALHRRLGARMVAFAGYSMPVQYPAGLLAEHLHTRAAAGLFDVSHMGQATLTGPHAAAYLETLTPADIAGLAIGRQRYGFFTNQAGGIVDDLMISRLDDQTYFLIVNASRKAVDFALIAAALPPGVIFTPLPDRALIALQGPRAAAVLPALADQPFMTVTETTIAGVPCLVSRSGYTGEDGFEISCPAEHAAALAEHLLADPRVAPIGLGARDSLRLEAGLCLHGNDIDEATTPTEAALTWAMGKRRRAERNYPGADIIATTPTRRRVGIRPEGRAPARAGTPILAADGTQIGTVTSGGFAPSLGAPIAMGYVTPAHAAEGTAITLLVRDKPLPARIVAMPFVPHNYKR